MMKKHILTAMTVCLLALTLPVSALASSTSFTDVPENAYYQDAVSWAVEQGITTGTTASTFSPESTCTRAQILTFLWRAAGSPQPSDHANDFTDVKETDYFYNATYWALEHGLLSEADVIPVIGGFSHLFPNTPCTREEVVTYLWALAGSPGAEGDTFTDVPFAKAGLVSAVYWAVSVGVTNGTSPTTFSPEKTCTRGQIVTFLHRAFADGDARPGASGNVADSDLEAKTVDVTYVDAEDPNNLLPGNYDGLQYNIYGASEGTVMMHSDLQMVSNDMIENIVHFCETMHQLDGNINMKGTSMHYNSKNCGTYEVDGNDYELYFNFMSTKVGRNVFLNALNYFGGDMGVNVWRMLREHYFFRSNVMIPISDELAAKYGLTITMLEDKGYLFVANVSDGTDTWKIQYGCSGRESLETFIWIPS